MILWNKTINLLGKKWSIIIHDPPAPNIHHVFSWPTPFVTHESYGLPTPFFPGPPPPVLYDKSPSAHPSQLNSIGSHAVCPWAFSFDL